MKLSIIDKNPLLQLITLVCIIMISSIIFSIMGIICGTLIDGQDFIDAYIKNDISSANSLKLIQLFAQIGTFIIPALIFAKMVDEKPGSYLTINKTAKFAPLLIGILIMIFAQGFISALAEWNANIKLPESLSKLESWMQSSEAENAKMTEILLSGNSVYALLFNIFLVAIIPAIGEELIFRGIIQNIIQKWIKSGLGSVIITAFIFSFIHFQFYGFFPRLVLGFLLGFAFWKSGRIWIPICMHFINNAGAVILFWLQNNGVITDANNLLNVNDNISLIIISTFLFISLTFAFNNIYKNKTI